MSEFNYKQIDQPLGVRVQLYKHQLTSVYNMELLEETKSINCDNDYIIKTKLAVLCDSTGYGKTLSILALICRDRLEWDCSIPFEHEIEELYMDGLVKKCTVQSFQKLDTTLILVPKNLLKQWIDEINKTTLTFFVVTTRIDLLNLQAHLYDVVITSSEMYNKIIETYSRCVWKRFIYDEPSSLKVPNMLKIHAGFTWLITGTPEAIYGNQFKCRHSYMKDIVGDNYYNFSTLLNKISIKNNIEYIQESFNMPKTFHFTYKCLNPTIFEVIYPFINDRVKYLVECGNIEGAVKLLGGNKCSNVVNVIIDKKKNEINDIDIKIAIIRAFSEDESQIVELERKKNHINEQINSINERFEDMLKGTCNICFSAIKNPLLESNCQNIFCGQCLLSWLQIKNTCPLCRNHIDPKSLIYITNENDISSQTFNTEHALTKLDTILKIIENNAEGQFLIFSEDDSSYEVISTTLIDKNITCCSLKGHHSDKNIELFKNGNIKVLLLNSKFSGTGLNLVQATDIILYHKMKKHIELQAISRANRLGRTKTLNVHHLN